MALLNRISQLFKADFHAVLDRVEEPETLLRQAIREMEQSLAEAELRHRQTLAEGDELKQRQAELEQALKEVGEELEVCFESDKDDLARDFIRRKLQIQRLRKSVIARLCAIEKLLIGQQNARQQNSTAVEGMRQKAELLSESFCSNDRYPTTRGDFIGSAHELGVSDNDIEVAFLREKKRRAQP